jgi:hypothetical protein
MYINNRRFEQRTGVNRKFVYHHDGDINGLLHWIGTQHDTQPWTNPNKLGLVGLSSSQVDRGQLTDLLEEKNSSFFLNPSVLYTHSSAPSQHIYASCININTANPSLQ